MKSPPPLAREPLQLLSVVIPALNEEGCIAATVEHLHLELRLQKIPHEILVIDDGSTDSTWSVLQDIHATEHPLFVMQHGRVVVQKAANPPSGS